jgi:secreted Zn-dependent insulinase-like peptidase
MHDQVSTFNIHMVLTDKGLANVHQITRIVFAFINKLKQETP